MSDTYLEAARLQSASQLRTIGAALLSFVGGIGPEPFRRGKSGRVPASLDEVVSEAGGPPSLLRSPLEGVEYVLTGAPIISTSHTVIAYERGAKGMVNVLCGDGHVESLTEQEAEAALRRGIQ